jgi:hypothetical protein
MLRAPLLASTIAALAFIALAGLPAHAADEKAKKAPEHKTTQSKSYIMVDPIYTTIVADNQAKGMLMVGAGLDIPDDKLREMATRSMPVLRDAYIRNLMAFTANAPGDAPTTLYAIMGTPVYRASPKFRALAVFHDHIFQAIRKQQWQMARELIGQCRRLSGASQKLYDLHLTRIAYFEQHPPGADWGGAFRPIPE